MYVPEFYLRQKVTLTANRFELRAAQSDGALGELLGIAQQKRMALKEQVTFYADEPRTHPVFSFRARKVVDLASGYDVFDAKGAPIGFFRKEFGASLMRSTFHVEGPGFAGTGHERSRPVALARRFLDVSFLPIHFDFTDGSGTPLLSVDRRMSMRDHYRVRVPDERVDFRIAAALAVGLDVLMGR